MKNGAGERGSEAVSHHTSARDALALRPISTGPRSSRDESAGARWCCCDRATGSSEATPIYLRVCEPLRDATTYAVRVLRASNHPAKLPKRLGDAPASAESHGAMVDLTSSASEGSSWRGLVRAEGVEPSFHAWEAHVMAVILRPRLKRASLRLVGAVVNSRLSQTAGGRGSSLARCL